MDFGTALSSKLASSSADFACRKRDKAIAEENEDFKIKPWFYKHPQHCDNIAHTLSEMPNHHNSTIFRNNKLADNMWKIREYFHFLLFLRRHWEAISKTRAIGFHQTFISFLEFGNPAWWNPRNSFWNSTWPLYTGQLYRTMAIFLGSCSVTDRNIQSDRYIYTGPQIWRYFSFIIIRWNRSFSWKWSPTKRHISESLVLEWI